MTDLDEALERFGRVALEFSGGLANHGPMVVEALGRLGHSALIGGFVDVYIPRFRPLEEGRAIPRAEQSAALGHPTRMADWVATMLREAEAKPWRALLARWLEPLLPGLFAGSAHGLLRTAHAVRAQGDEETAPRRRELALGLAYWAATYQELPGVPGRRAEPGFGAESCFAAARVVPRERRKFGLFSDAVRVLDNLPEERAPFIDILERFDAGAAGNAKGGAIHALCRVAAERYLENPHARIAYVHCLTAPSALRLLAPHLDAKATKRAVGYALQAALALHVVSAGDTRGTPSTEVMRLAEHPAEIRYRAACSLEEHAIKFVEACLREDAVCPAPVFRVAAADAAIHLDSGQGRGGVV